MDWRTIYFSHIISIGQNLKIGDIDLPLNVEPLNVELM